MSKLSQALSFIQLEDRITPVGDLYRWAPTAPLVGGGTSEKWSDTTNWDLNYVDPTGANPPQWVHGPSRVPGYGDLVDFAANGFDCDVDIPVILSSMMYTSNNDMILSGSLTIQQRLTFSSSLGTIRSANPALVARSSLTIQSPGTLDWDSGQFAGLTVTIDRTNNVNASLDVATAAGSTDSANRRRMSNTDISVYGEINWKDGNVYAHDSSLPSSITVQQGGQFNNKSSSTWGGIGAISNPDFFRVTNLGTVTVESKGQTAFAGGYFTSGTTQVKSGIFEITRKAEQTAGVFQLDSGTTVKVSGPGQVLRIYDGLIAGDATVNGNLTLGYDPATNPNAPQTHPAIAPRKTTMVPAPFGGGTIPKYTPGILTISQSFEIFSPTATSYFIIESGTQHSKITVFGTATIRGNIDATRDAAYTPERGIELTLISSSKLFGNFNGVLLDTPFCALWSGSPDEHRTESSTRRFFVARARATTFVFKVVRPGLDMYSP